MNPDRGNDSEDEENEKSRPAQSVEKSEDGSEEEQESGSDNEMSSPLRKKRYVWRWFLRDNCLLLTSPAAESILQYLGYNQQLCQGTPSICSDFSDTVAELLETVHLNG